MQSLSARPQSFEYIWSLSSDTVRGLTGMKPGTALQSASFQDPTQCSTWYLELYPGGYDKDQGYMSVFVCLASSGWHVVNFVLSVQSEDATRHYSIHNLDGVEFCKGDIHKKWGYRKFVPRKMLLDDSKYLLPSNTLTIHLQLIFPNPLKILPPSIYNKPDIHFIWHIHNPSSLLTHSGRKSLLSPPFLDQTGSTTLWSLELYPAERGYVSLFLRLDSAPQPVRVSWTFALFYQDGFAVGKPWVKTPKSVATLQPWGEEYGERHLLSRADMVRHDDQPLVVVFQGRIRRQNEQISDDEEENGDEEEGEEEDEVAMKEVKIAKNKTKPEVRARQDSIAKRLRSRR